MTIEHATTAGATAAASAPLWISEINPYLQVALSALGIAWLIIQIYYKFKKDK